MAFADPQSITINSVAQSLALISRNSTATKTSAVYMKADGTFKYEISHELTGKPGNIRVRSLARLTEKAVVTNPLDSSNDYDTASVSLLWDRPEMGFSQTRMEQLTAGLAAELDSTFTSKFFGRES